MPKSSSLGRLGFTVRIAIRTGFDGFRSHETVATPNDPKLSDSGVRRGTCMVGGKAVVEAGAVTHGAVRCSAWLGDVGCDEARMVECSQ